MLSSQAMAQVVNYLTFQGPGCTPRDSVTHFESSSGNQIELMYRDMKLDVNGQNGQRATYCDLTLDLNVPAGWQVALTKVNQTGFAFGSSQNAVGRINIYARPNNARQANQFTRRQQPGPFNGDYDFTDQVTSRFEQFTACGDRFPRFNIQTEYSGTTALPGDRFYFDGARTNGLTTQRWDLYWRRCNNPPPPPRDDWIGSCLVVLETVWGENLSDHWGSSRSNDYNTAVYRAREDGVNRCQRARGSNNILKCTVVEGQCSATRARRP
jgi:hypothetical protein